MGSGKTLQAASICEALGVDHVLTKNNNLKPEDRKSLKELYDVPGLVNYRNIIMCPGHLVQKWGREIEEQIPFSKVTIVDDFNKLVELKAHGPARDGREFYVMSKDFAKLSYMERPVPTSVKKGPLYYRTCKDCGKTVSGTQCSCGCTDYTLEKTDTRVKGLACPECGRVLLRYGKVDMSCPETLTATSFTEKRDSNSHCIYCGANLWQPHVKNLTPEMATPKKHRWIRLTHWANKAQKNKKTVWILEDAIPLYLCEVGVSELNRIDSDGVRKYSPAQYIKKHLKGFFDVAVFDEMHLYKSGGSAQGAAMHALCKASKRQLGLTGTIAGGYASDLFYTLFRLDPKRMTERGYQWTSESKFSEKYGTIELLLKEGELDRSWGKSSRIKNIGAQGRKKPGISPLIFLDFLLDRTVFLDITDMSKYVPQLTERVVTVKGDDEVMAAYNKTIDILKSYSQSMGMKILSTMLQFSLSYLDKPYGVEPLLNPITGSLLAKPDNFPEYEDEDTLLPKEEALIQILNDELREGRNCFVYAEYTASPSTCVTERLSRIISRNCSLVEGEVQILHSESPEASKRESWIQDKAVQGARVVITNPKCVETGLDFCFTKNGQFYNYPTIIFYQMGYSLQTIWQAAHRHFRLNQIEDCRTYYMAYAGTIQQAVISIIAKKMNATAAIQGRFSGEGLAAMAEGVDTKVILAKALQDKDMGDLQDDLQAMFDVKAADNGDDTFANIEKMKVFEEVTGRPYERVASAVNVSPVKTVRAVKIVNHSDETVTEKQVTKKDISMEVLTLEQNAKAVVGNIDDIWDFFESQVDEAIVTLKKATKKASEKKKSKKEQRQALLSELGSCF
jgi:hypothetical protein